MPHFFASDIKEAKFPAKCAQIEFILEAKSAQNSLILAKFGQRKIILSKEKKPNGYLIKYNKNLKIASKFISKIALKEYAQITHAKIISHNLNIKKNSDFSDEFLLDFWDLANIKAEKIIIEIGFGSGRNLINMAQNRADCVFLGLEVYNPAIEQVLNQIRILGLKNLFILHLDCRILFEMLADSSVDEVYLHFPIPWDKNPQRRVLSSYFLNQVWRVLKNGGYLWLRTDSKEYFEFARTIETDFKLEIYKNEKTNIISKYEARWQRQNKDIFDIKFIKDSKFEISPDSILKPKSKQLEILDAFKNLCDCGQKICDKECFLHIKNIYIFPKGFVIFIVYGAIFAPQNAFLVIQNKEVEIWGEIIPTSLNIRALGLIERIL